MATLNALKQALRQKATATASSPTQPLSDSQYNAGLNILKQGPGWATYGDFIIPQLSQLVASLCDSHISVSVLEIGPGSQSVLGHLPRWLRRKVRRYAAFEPNIVSAIRLEEWLRSSSETKCPLPCLESPPAIHQVPFSLDSDTRSRTGDEKFDIILFCHSMYGLKPKHLFVKRALEMIVEGPTGGMVVLFHRDGFLQEDLDGLVCHRTASFPTGIVRLADTEEALDYFAPFINGFITQNVNIRAEWRKVCRALGRREVPSPDHLFFSSPDVMVAFTRESTTLLELTARVPSRDGAETRVKNREARLHRPASIMRPTAVGHVQECVRWALKHRVGLTVVGGGHSGHCLWPNVVAVDMGAFNQVHTVTAGEDVGRGKSDSDANPLIVAGAGCKTGDIIGKAMEAGLTVPLGARPSVGAGLWLQGGIGHLARRHGLSCDAIVGVVMVSVDSGEVLCVGRVPERHRPAGAVRPRSEDGTDLLWAIRGAGTNFGIVISVTFKAYTAPVFLVRDWNLWLSDSFEARSKLRVFDEFARKLSLDSSADAYLYLDQDKLRLGVTMLECPATGLTAEAPKPLDTIFGPENSFKAVNSVDLFDTEMYMHGMHGGHGGGKTCSFKRCVFLKHIRTASVAGILVKAVETCPSSRCYLHLLQGGGAVGDVAVDATAFGCRDWDFACVVTGVWPGDQAHDQQTEAARAALQWVYQVVQDLLPFSSGVYGADLGPDPRDATLVARAFGPNLPRLVRLKRSLDPRNVLALACPLLPLTVPKAPTGPELIILVTGDGCVGKDYCAEVCVAVCSTRGLTAHAASISEETKRQYAAATGADLHRLLSDRGYKERHRPALTAFFQSQVRQRPRLPEEHFLNAVHGAVDVDVLLITGMRDEAPVAAWSHLVPDSRLIEMRVTASKEIRRARRGGPEREDGDRGDMCKGSCNINGESDSTYAWEDHCPSLICHNNTPGSEAATRLAEQHLLPFFDEDLRRLASMVRPAPDFPRAGIEFRHVLDIAQQQGGLALCTSLLRTRFTGDWTKVDALACCEAGGFVFASALAEQVNSRPLVLIRKAGKLPPPTVSTVKAQSHISSWSSASSVSMEERIEIGRDVVPRGASVVVVEDVLATGVTLCAVLELLGNIGIGAEHVSVMVVAEFPAHRGRELLRRRGFGKVHVQSLLVFGGT